MGAGMDIPIGRERETLMLIRDQVDNRVAQEIVLSPADIAVTLLALLDLTDRLFAAVAGLKAKLKESGSE